MRCGIIVGSTTDNTRNERSDSNHGRLTELPHFVSGTARSSCSAGGGSLDVTRCLAGSLTRWFARSLACLLACLLACWLACSLARWLVRWLASNYSMRLVLNEGLPGGRNEVALSNMLLGHTHNNLDGLAVNVVARSLRACSLARSLTRSLTCSLAVLLIITFYGRGTGREVKMAPAPFDALVISACPPPPPGGHVSDTAPPRSRSHRIASHRLR